MLESISGDADLFVSFTSSNPTKDNHDYESRRKNYIDQVTLTENGNNGWLNRPIFFSVYGTMKSQIRISFTYVYKATHNELLTNARPIGDSNYIHESLPDENAEGFYSFKPWWSGQENRTSVFIADTIFNKVFFYAMWNEYPKHFLTSMHDVDDIIAVYGNNPDYHNNGEYFIRLRPDF